MKMKFKKLKFKEMFVEHVEKVLLSVAGVCLILFIASSLGREKLPPEREPDKLILQSDNAQKHVAQSDPALKLTEIRPDDAVIYSESVRRPPVDLAIYDTKVVMLPPIVESKVLREEPAYLPLTDLRVGVGFGSIATLNPNELQPDKIRKRRAIPGAEEDMLVEQEIQVVDQMDRRGAKASKNDILVVRYWAVVTGLVPIRKQKEEYVKTFENAVGFDLDQDLPKYLGYLIERAEVTSSDMQNLKWTVIKKDDDFMLSWTEEMQEPVTPEYVYPMFASPLAPWVAEEWPPYVGHPEIPFEPKRNQLGEGGMMPGGRGMGGREMGGPGRGDFFEGEMRGGRGGPREMMEEGGEGEEDLGGFDQGGRIKKPQMMDEEAPEERRRKAEVIAMLQGRDIEKTIKGVDNLLFRFCDFSVQPGKRYVYRVKLGLLNPNRGVPVRYLKRAELAELKTQATDYSATSPVAEIPYGDKILVGPVTPATVMKEPTAKVRIVQVKKDVGAAVPMEEDAYRGSLADYVDKETKYIDPRDRVVKSWRGDFETKAVVLDMRGGRTLLVKDKEMREPGEVLILSRTGQLVALNEFDDEDVWKNYIVPEKEDSQDEMMMPGGNPMDLEGMRGMQPRGPRGKKSSQAFDPLDGGMSPQGQRQLPKKPAKQRKPDR